MTTFDELFAEHNLTPKERKALVMHLATLRAQKTVEALQDGPPASAPSTPPHAVVEAVPLEWTEELGPMPGTPYNHCAASTPFGRFLITWKGWKENDWPTVDETPWGDFFGSWRTVKEAQAACEAEYAIRLLRGIAPKAAQPVEGER